jgi:hypothetical protein
VRGTRYNVVDAAHVRAAVALIEAARRKETELATAAAGRSTRLGHVHGMSPSKRRKPLQPRG